MESLLNFGHTAIAFIVIISIIVFIHEFGHYLAARLCGVKIEAFAIGFGKEIFGWTDKAQTRWKVCIAPLGGYVKMYGDATEASTPDAERLDAMSEEEKRISFHYKPLWQKAIIVAAGPAANFILAIAIFTFLIFTNGLDTTEPVVGSIIEGSAAEDAGLQPGDRITAINDQEISTFNQISRNIITNLGEPVHLEIERDGNLIRMDITPRMQVQKDALGNEVERPLIGIGSQKLTSENINLVAALGESVKRTWQMIELSLHFLGQIISGDRSAEELKGPIGIADLSGKAAQQDIFTIIWFMALLSVNLGFVNILPIPPLDGGHLLFYVLEGARGRPMAEHFQEWGYRAGFALIMLLMGFTIYNDLKQLIFS